LVLVGWLFLPGLFVWAKVRRLDMSRAAQPPVRELFRPWALTAAFGALAAVVLFLAIVWDVPGFCHGPVPVNCEQATTGQWKVGITSNHSRAAPEKRSANRYISKRSASTCAPRQRLVFTRCAWHGSRPPD
jgi:hypothetical protein